jgi:hypothetical protein
MRDDLADPGLLDRLAGARTAAAAIPLGARARRLTGEITVELGRTDNLNAVETHAVLADEGGLTYRIPLGSVVPGNPALRFAVDLPDTGGHELRLAGFDASTVTLAGGLYRWELHDLAVQRGAAGEPVPADGAREPIPLGGGGWRVVDGSEAAGEPALAAGRALLATYELPEPQNRNYFLDAAVMRFSVIPPARPGPVPVVATPQALSALRIPVGGTTRLNLGGGQVEVRVVAAAEALPAATTPAALLVDLPSLGTALYQDGRTATAQEWWLATSPDRHAEAADAARRLGGLDVVDRRAISDAAGRDPYGLGGRAALFAAALGATLLALVGLAVDARATARRRAGELAVLHTLGAGPRLLARALIAEQTFLAGLGVAVGLLVGVGVAAVVAPLVILTPAAGRPVPEPLLHIAWGRATATAGIVLLAALAMSALIAVTMRQRMAAAQLRIGGDQ